MISSAGQKCEHDSIPKRPVSGTLALTPAQWLRKPGTSQAPKRRRALRARWSRRRGSRDFRLTDGPRCGEWRTGVSDRRGCRSGHARARVLPNAKCMVAAWRPGFDRGTGCAMVEGVGGREDRPREICGLRVAISKQSASQGSLTIESDVTALKREGVTTGQAQKARVSGYFSLFRAISG